jgi:iron(III) transport system substrate-binding protein
MTRIFRLSTLALFCLSFLSACTRDQPVVVIYTALDKNFSEPILREFERRTGIRVLAKYDAESTKTVGLVNAIRAERARPRCDVFWNNEVVNTIRLADEGLFQPYAAKAARAFPLQFRDPSDLWFGFAARARVLLVNTNLVPQEDMPATLSALADPKWKGRVGLAKPLFGTTATHVACLFELLGPEAAQAVLETIRANEVQVLAGNRTVAAEVAAGRLAFGLTDTDDALVEQDAGRPVKMVFPDIAPGQMGLLVIPNTVALIKGAPHPEHGRELIEYLLSPEVEEKLAKSEAGQIPLNPAVLSASRAAWPAASVLMRADFYKAADRFTAAAEYIEKTFLRP